MKPCLVEGYGPPNFKPRTPMAEITDERLGPVMDHALAAVHPRGATVDAMTFTLRRLGYAVDVARVRAVLNRLVDSGSLEFVERHDVKPTPGRMCFWYRRRVE